MLATSVRESPCSALWRGSSDGRETVQVSPSTATPISGCMFRWTSPLDPFTVTALPFTMTVTPLGIWIGILPMRDMFSFSLPDESEEFAAGALRARLAVGHQPLRGAEDRDAESVAHARDLRHRDVLAEAGARHSAHLADDRLPALRVLEHDAKERTAIGTVHGLIVGDEVIGLQQPRDLEFHLRCRHVDAAMLRSARIADPRQHVGNWVGHAHGVLPVFPMVSPSHRGLLGSESSVTASIWFLVPWFLVVGHRVTNNH